MTIREFCEKRKRLVNSILMISYFTSMPFLQAAPMPGGLEVGALLLGLGIAIIFHEVAHGYVALRLGDPTAQLAGRLTLNPVKHIDMWGTILLPIILLIVTRGQFAFGWAKPVPVNYYNLKYGKYGPLLVALAGPATNFLFLAFFASLLRISPADTALPMLFAQIAIINGVLMFFNLIPIPPLDGSKILYVFLERRPDIIQWMEQYGMYVLIGVFILGDRLLFTFVYQPAAFLTQLFAGGLFF